MFSHIMVGADDVERSKIFYDAVLGELGHEPGVIDDKGRCFYFTPTGIFSISKPINGQPACHGNGSTVGFAAKNPTEAKSWHEAGLANGGSICEDPPGEREGVTGKLYLAYLRSPSYGLTEDGLLLREVLMAGGFAKDGAVQDQIDASLEDEVNRARSQLPHGESALECDECGAAIPEARRKVMPGVRLCVSCQEAVDQEQAAFAGYNRRGSKDSQLR